jgi:hypothetical protein
MLPAATHLLAGERVDGHAEQVVKVRVGAVAALEEGHLVLRAVVVDVGGDGALGLLGEGAELVLAQLRHNLAALAVRHDELALDDHLHEARLVREALVHRLELLDEEVLQKPGQW